MDDRTPVLSAENSTRVKKLKTVPLFSLHLLVSTTISTVGIVLAVVWPETKRCEAYFIMLYLRVGFYLFTVLFDTIVKHLHNNHRIAGYHDFAREIQCHHTIPLKVVSLWNSIILGVAAAVHHYYGENFMTKCVQSLYSPVVYLTAFNTVESLIFFVVHGTYILKILKFNNQQLVPDAMRGSSSTVTVGSLGLVHSQSEVHELLEKQSDLIEYLRDHCNRLNQKLQQMSNQLRTVTLSPHPAI